MQFGAAGSIQYAGMDKTTLQNTFTDIDFMGGFFSYKCKTLLTKQSAVMRAAAVSSPLGARV